MRQSTVNLLLRDGFIGAAIGVILSLLFLWSASSLTFQFFALLVFPLALVMLGLAMQPDTKVPPHSEIVNLEFQAICLIALIYFILGVAIGFLYRLIRRQF